MKRLLAIALPLLFVPAAGAEEVPVVVFPRPKTPKPPDELIFSHQLHVDENGLECTDCHESVVEATTIEETSTPEMDVCEECHEDEVGETCEMCHTAGEDAEATLKPWVTEVRFSHKAHLDRKTECTTCHPAALTSQKSSDRLTPAMKTCAQCHQDRMDRLACSMCHTDLASLRRPSSQVAVHKAGWFPLHPAWARGSSALCAQCHEQSFCAECHEKTGAARVSEIVPDETRRTLVHRGDWIGRHALEAQSDPSRCLACHGTQTCTECHARELGLKEGRGDYRRSPHPVGYLQRDNPAGFHGKDARRRPWRCAACHDEGAASICVDCHKVGGPGGNPHPPGFDRGSKKGSVKNSSGTCRPCHNPS